MMKVNARDMATAYVGEMARTTAMLKSKGLPINEEVYGVYCGALYFLERDNKIGFENYVHDIRNHGTWEELRAIEDIVALF